MRSAKPDSAPPLYGIIGYPLTETWSPHIYVAAFRALGLPGHYAPYAVPPERLKQGIEALAALDVKGFSVTVPHKENIIPHLSSVAPLARDLGAVNTVIMKTRGWHGENTDVEGFAQPLARHARKLAGHGAVVIGAGGAARAVAYALLSKYKMSAVLILARQGRKAERLASWAQSISAGTAVSGMALGTHRQWQGAFRQARLVVQATPLGGPGQENFSVLPAGVTFHEGQIAYDLVYARATKFLARARRNGAVALDGRAMLLHQAAGAFRLFTGKSFPMRQVQKELQGSGLWPSD